MAYSCNIRMYCNLILRLIIKQQEVRCLHVATAGTFRYGSTYVFTSLKGDGETRYVDM